MRAELSSSILRDNLTLRALLTAISRTDREQALLDHIEELQDTIKALEDDSEERRQQCAEWGFTFLETELYLALKETRPVHSTLILRLAWRHCYNDDDYPEEKIISVMICHMRKKLKENGAPIGIKTVWGKGYQIERTAE